MTQKIEDIINRNVSDIIQKSELEQLLAGNKKLTVYLGVDPSSPEIHLGHAVVLWKLKEFQDLGHHVILLIGDFTAQIGDPTGKSKERVPLTHQQVLDNAKSYKEQAARILDFTGDNAAQVQFNSAWLDKLTLKEIIMLASNFTVQQMIERDMFQKRLQDNQPIGLHEFLYPLMVGYDCVKMDVDVEIGGNDQLFNIKAGRTLMEKMTGKRKVVLVCDLLTGSDGSKMSKSSGNIISITAAPEQMFGQLMSISDDLILEYACLCTDMNDDELFRLEQRLQTGDNPRDVKLDMAERVVRRYSSDTEAKKARQSFTDTFTNKTPQGEFKYNKSEAPLFDLVQAIIHATDPDTSSTQIRRLIADGAVEVEGKVMKDASVVVTLGEESKAVRVGKKHFVNVVLSKLGK